MFSQLFYPLLHCLLCQQTAQQSTHTIPLCSGCLKDLVSLHVFPSQQPITPNRLWTHEWCSANYAPPLPQALHHWKHQGNTAFAALFTHLMLDNPPIWLPDILPQIDAILPMPISPQRRLQRGFNQCDELATAVSASYHLPILSSNAVMRQHKAAQSTLNRAQRIDNIKNSFTIQTDVSQKTLLLIDDICTTAATLTELTHCLQNAGAKNIVVWVVARKLP